MQKREMQRKEKEGWAALIWGKEEKKNAVYLVLNSFLSEDLHIL